MRSPVRVAVRVRVSLVLAALMVGALLAGAAPAAQAASSFGLESVFASNCKNTTCGEFEIPSLQPKAVANSELYTQAAGHPNGGITQFKVNTEGEFPNAAPSGIATGGVVTHVRTDVGVGVSTNPEAVAKCTMKEFDASEKEEEAIPGTGFYPAPKCAESGEESTVIGINQVIVWLGPKPSPEGGDLPLEGTTYNLVQPAGRASDFGVALKLPIPVTKGALEKAFAEKGHPLGEPTEKYLAEQQYYAHTLIEGGLEWGQEANGTGKGDYHDYYEIEVSPELPLISSRLTLYGNIGNTGKGGFITNPSHCAGTGPQTTTTVTLTPEVGAQSQKGYSGALGTEGCNGEFGLNESQLTIPPFEPGFNLHPETSQSDKPDGITTELSVNHSPSPEAIDNSQVRDVSVTLPEGMTINPSGAGEVTKACTPAQARIHSSTFGVACPGESELGAVTLEVPTLPAESLKGNLYLGGPEGGGAITGPPYTVYLNAQSERYGVDVRVEGKVVPNESTGQLTATFTDNPEQPFSNAIIKFKGGELAPIANPLTCGTASSGASLVPYTGNPASLSPSVSPFSVDSNGSGGACSSPLPFQWSQTVLNQPPGYAGAKTSYTLNVGRSDGQQYVSRIRTVLPAGLVGLLPSVTKCPEAQANAGTCPSESQIGVVNVSAGAGKGYGFVGRVYLTGPYGGAPFGMSVVVPAVAGPFDLGNVVTRGTIDVEPYTARVVATSTLPTIVKGIPLRIKGVTVSINKQGFLQNPTNCGVLSTDTTLISTMGATQTLSTPFQVNNCGALAFKPAFGSATNAKTSKKNGASLETTLNVPAGDANVKSATVQLPKQLPSRLTTLQKACPEATFASNPYHCPSGSFVGGARANTPTLATKLTGPAILVSHGGRAFPDLDLVLEAEGVRVILVGNTNIKNGITTTTFATTPDAPVTSITVNLPTGSHSALTANGNLCKSNLKMPTTVVSQNGITFKQNTTIKVRNCPVMIVGHKTAGDTAYLTVRTFEPGRISGKGYDMATTFRHLKHAKKKVSLKVHLSKQGRSHARPFHTKIRVGFVPKSKGKPTSATHVVVRFG
jgi:hypothetical protein